MDDLTLAVLARELTQDAEVALGALTLAHRRLGKGTDSGVEGCAHHIARLFNVVEQMGLRVARAFENNVDDARDWHAELIRRLSLDIPEIRPAFWPEALLQPLRELRAFRHVFNHSCDLTLDPNELRLCC